MSRLRPRAVLIFLDGLGIGRKDHRINPFFAAPLTYLRSRMAGGMVSARSAYFSSKTFSAVPLNATLGIAGLPQSGTGQTALFTGVNAARMIGKHFGPYPYSTLRPVIAEKNVFKVIMRGGGRVHFANAYPRQFFEYLSAGHRRITVTTTAWLSCGYPLNDANALRSGKALSADITNRRWPGLGYADIDVISPRTAGERLARISENADFVLFEYFLTDHAGHSQSMEEAISVLADVDGLIEGFLETADLKATLLIITGDHGNIEDLSVRTHTRNPVPLFAAGNGHDRFVASCRSLTHVAPALAKMFS